MGWLLELLVEGIREMLSQFVIDMMTLVTDMFTELLSCDLSLFEELFSVVGDLYTNVMLPMGIALLLLICVWQLFKSMFGKAGVASEDPIELVCRTGISLFYIVVAKPLVDYILTVAGTPYQWIAGTDIEVSSFSEYVSALEGLTGGLGIDSLNIAVLMLIMQFVVAWNYFKMLFVIAERYVLLGIILTYLGFADADAFANEAQSEELANLKVRVEQILDKEEYEHEIMAIIEQNRDVRLEEIAADKQEKYNDYELSVIDEYETKFKRNARYYLSIFLLDIWDSNTRNEFLGYSSEWGDMTTNLSSPYDAYFQEAAQSYGVPVALLKAMGKTESNFNQSAVSSAGAIGVMQLMPGTAASLGVDPYDARQNIMGGAKYIAGNLEQFKGYSNGLELAIAAYVFYVLLKNSTC